MSFNHKITDLKFHINKLVPKDVRYTINCFLYGEYKDLETYESIKK
jgi:hypothetical protein